MKVTRKQKIDYLTKIYIYHLRIGSGTIELNQIIIDSVGISGLKKIKKLAWGKTK